MKKMICLILALVLCMGAVAAMAVSSPTTDDMYDTSSNKGSTKKEEPATLVVDLVTGNEMTEAEKAKLANELAVLNAAKESGNVLSYYDAEKNADGATVIVKNEAGEPATVAEAVAAAGIENPIVNEMMPLYVQNVEAVDGKAVVSHTFPTQYAKGETVVVVIEVVDSQGNIIRYVLEGKGAEDGSGALIVEYPAEVLLAAQNNAALPMISVISDDKTV